MGWKWIGEVSGDISFNRYTKLWEPLVWGSVHIRVMRATRERKGENHPGIQVFLDAARPDPENPKPLNLQLYKQPWSVMFSTICANQPALQPESRGLGEKDAVKQEDPGGAQNKYLPLDGCVHACACRLPSSLSAPKDLAGITRRVKEWKPPCP